jgi:hypothetical protein
MAGEGEALGDLGAQAALELGKERADDVGNLAAARHLALEDTGKSRCMNPRAQRVDGRLGRQVGAFEVVDAAVLLVERSRSALIFSSGMA